MFSLIVLLRFSKSLACDRTKCLFLNDEPFRVRLTLLDLNPVELKYCPLMISLDKCTGRGSGTVLFPRICVPKETKDINVKAFNIITNENEAKTIAKHISCVCKCKLNSTACNSRLVNVNRTCKKYNSWDPSTCICDNSKYLKSIADTSVIECDEIITVLDIVSE